MAVVSWPLLSLCSLLQKEKDGACALLQNTVLFVITLVSVIACVKKGRWEERVFLASEKSVAYAFSLCALRQC